MKNKILEALDAQRQIYARLGKEAQELNLQNARAMWEDRAAGIEKATEIVSKQFESEAIKPGRYLPSRHPQANN